MKPTIEPLILELGSYNPESGPAPMIEGNEMQEFIPAVHERIRKAGYLVVDYVGEYELLVKGGFKLHAVLRLAERGKALGITARALEQPFPNYVMLDTDHLPVNLQFAVAVHELAHCLTPEEIGNMGVVLRNTPFAALIQQQMEVIAFGTQFAVCHAMGVDAKVACMRGLKLYGAIPQTVKESESMILSISEDILKCFQTTK